MIQGSEIRRADFPIEQLLLDRWSPRAMSGEEIAQEELMRLFEAARWAPSSFNAQQWRALYAVAAPSTGQCFSNCWSKQTNPGQRMQLCLSSSFRERRSIIMTSRRSHTPTIPVQRGRISRSKVFDKTSSCTECKDLITNVREHNCAFP